MKFIASFILILFISACNQHSSDSQNPTILYNQVDSLSYKLAHAYKPGLGEFMTTIQVHHAKLWFAGKNQNWELADFEIHEIMETVEDIKTFQSERKESQMLSMLAPPLDTLYASIQTKQVDKFKSSFILLTNTCNNCHNATGFGFNRITIPDTPPFSNQGFDLR